MKIAVKLRLPAIGCALALLLCFMVVRPSLEMGIVDDPSYTRTAQLLAATGHVVYNGWTAAMLGWQLYLGAAFIKLFGFSFTVLRVSTLLVGMAAAFLTQRSMVRSGLTEWNATLATLTLVLSPLFLPLTFSYMTDIGGLLVIVLCFYSCLRVLQARSDQTACLWVAFAALSNAIGGTSRQISWLGLLLMIPATLWLMRKRRPVLICGLISLALGIAIMIASLEWYKHQPLANPEPLLPNGLTLHRGIAAVRTLASQLFDAPVFLLPVLLAFPPKLRLRNGRVRLVLVVGGLLSAALLCWILRRPDPVAWLEPSGQNYVTSHGVLDGTMIQGERPVILGEGIRIALTIAVLASLTALAAVLSEGRMRLRTQSSDARTGYALEWLLIPFSVAYLALLLPRASIGMVFDRYLVPLLFVSLLFLVRYYQDHLGAALPRFAAVLIAVVACFAIAATHDAFAMLRARLQAAEEVHAGGIPMDVIDAGWEFNSWIQLEESGELVPEPTANSAKQNSPSGSAASSGCRPQLWTHIPRLRPKYMLSYDPADCGGSTSFLPVAYREWIGPRTVTVYVVRAPGTMSDVPGS